MIRQLPQLRQLLRLALPVSAGNASLMVINLVDLVMVGRLDDSAVAVSALGYGMFAVWCAASLAIGLGHAVEVIVSRRMGEGDFTASADPLHAALRFSLTWGVLLSAVGAMLAGPLFEILTNAEDVRIAGTPYLEIRMAGWFVLLVSYAFRGFLWGIGRPVLYLLTTVVVQVANVALNFVFIYGWGPVPRLGVAGAGIASVIAMVLGVLVLAVVTSAFGDTHGVLRPSRRDRESRGALRGLAAPSTVNNLMIFISVLVFLGIAGRVGLTEAVVTAVGLNIARAFVVASSGFCTATGLLVSKSLGAGDRAGSSIWAWRGVGVGMVLFGAGGAVLSLFSASAAAAFSTDADVIAAATPVIAALGVVTPIEVGGAILAHAIATAGAVRVVAIWHIALVAGVFLPGAYVFGVLAQGGIWGLWIPLFAYRFAMTLAMLVVFLRRRWQQSVV